MVRNLLSIRLTTDNSCSVAFDPSGLTVKDLASQHPLLWCDSMGPLYTIRLPSSTAPSSTYPSPSSADFATTTSSTTWHRRLGHLGRDGLAQLSRGVAITCPQTTDEHLCHACQLGCHIFPLRSKSEAFSTLSHFFAWVSTQFGLTIKAIQCDNRREFDNNASRSFFLSHGVQLHMSCPYTSAQNGKAERMILTTNDVMRTLLFQAFLPAESLHTAAYLLNSLPSTASPAPTPHHALFGTPPSSVSSGVHVTLTPPPLLLTSWRPRSTRCVFLGYSPDHKGYRCFGLTSRRVLISQHVVFD
ncbi:hypothetical protein U9M48_034569 [Paspalum notatum var. saurae]|uniref:Integrase catalytic domain-containing protein n=1 Tax=Paspalum notatum var. saurae TaxID=547442 RepID=A0AAQ3UDS6_PASNO